MNLKARQRLNGTIFDRLGLRLERTRPTRRMLERTSRTYQPLPIEEVNDLRFRSTAWTYRVPVSQLVGRPIFGYGEQSWHPFVAAIAQILREPEIPYDRSLLKRFYEVFTPTTIADAHRLVEPGPLHEIRALSLFEPWSVPPPPHDDPYSRHPVPGSPLFGPASYAAGAAEWRRLKYVLSSVQKYGYQPDLFPRGRINVTVLRSLHSDRYLVRHGQHRAAVMAALGIESIEVGIHESLDRIVDEVEVDSWPHVDSGLITREAALELFAGYFAPPDSDPALEIGSMVGEIFPTRSM